jgi:hypothetical protein
MMRAGLAPRLMADGRLPEVGAWCGNTVELTEGDAAPLEALAHAIDGALPELGKLRAADGKSGPAPAKKRRKKSEPPAAVWDRARLARALADPAQRVFAITAIVAALDRISAAKPAHFLLLVDPLDPVVTGAAESTTFLEVLAALARSGRIRVIATLDSALLPAAATAGEPNTNCSVTPSVLQNSPASCRARGADCSAAPTRGSRRSLARCSCLNRRTASVPANALIVPVGHLGSLARFSMSSNDFRSRSMNMRPWRP